MEGSYVEERIHPSIQSKGSLTQFPPSTLRSAETENMPPQDKGLVTPDSPSVPSSGSPEMGGAAQRITAIS